MKLIKSLQWLPLLFAFFATSIVQGQTVTLAQTPNAQKCTGDTLRINLTVSTGFEGQFPANGFDVFMTPGMLATADFTDPLTRQIPIAEWEVSTGSWGNALLDTNRAGAKILSVVVPEDITTSQFYCIRLESSNPATVSDTFQVLVNVTTPASIDSIRGGFDNHLTPGDTTDWAKCVEDTVILYANRPGAVFYQWYKGGAPITTNGTYDSLLVWDAGLYYVEVSTGVCPGTSDEISISNHVPSPIVNFTDLTRQPWVEILDDPANLQVDSAQFCEADSLMFYGLPATNPAEAYTYQWFKDSLTLFGVDTIVPIKGQDRDTIAITADIMSGSVVPFYMELYLEVTDTITGCSNMTTFPMYVWMDTVPDVTITNIPFPGMTNTTTTICIEDSVLLSASVNSPDYDYQWQVRYPLSTGTWTSIPNDTLATLQVDTALIPDSAEYRLRVANLTCTWVSNSIQVNIVPNPVFQFLPGDSVAVCADDSVLVAVTGNGQQYTWSDGFIGTSQYISIPGTYWVRAQGVNQCITYDTLVVYPLVVNADAGPDQTIDPDTDAQMAASGGVSYYWFANEPVYFSNQRDPNTLTRPVKDTTIYYVEVTAANGCTAIDSMVLIVSDPFAGEADLSNIQNVMTPNGDGANDVLDLSELIGTDGCDIMIMNRWGSPVYIEENYSNGWTGVNDGGDELSDGTYYFVLTCDDEVRYQGAVTIIRNND